MVSFLLIAPNNAKAAKQTAQLGHLLDKQVEQAYVRILTEKQFEAFFNNEGFSATYCWEMPNLQKELRNLQLDYIVDLESSWRSWRLKNKLQVLDFTLGEHFILKRLLKNKKQQKSLLDDAIEMLAVFDLKKE